MNAKQQEPDDLRFRAGDIIIVDEEGMSKCDHRKLTAVNNQWYRGRVIPSGQQIPQDRSGLFPANYIEKESVYNGNFGLPQE
jgi:hypothetical protein